jgi:hypothetical protein
VPQRRDILEVARIERDLIRHRGRGDHEIEAAGSRIAPIDVCRSSRRDVRLGNRFVNG